MATNDSGNPPPISEYIRRWTHAMESLHYDSAFSILEEGLQAATREKNTEEINHYTNLIKYSLRMVETLTAHKERNIETRFCSMCGKGEADGCILVAGAECVICDECIKICVGVVDIHKDDNRVKSSNVLSAVKRNLRYPE
jgi:hypothetical protein